MSPRRLYALALVAALALATLAATAPPPAAGPAPAPRPIGFPTRTMGTYANVTIVTADSSASVATARVAHAALARVDSLMSNWTTTSEVARLNREAGAGTVVVHPEVARVLDAALALWRDSDGAFDITVEPLVRAWGFLGGRPHVPDSAAAAGAFRRVGAGQIAWDSAGRRLRFANDGVRVDLGGIAKGHAVDEAAGELRSRGVTQALVDLSGNMVAIGAPPGAEHWRIGLRDPRGRMTYFARLPLRDRAIATSGKYEQFVSENGETYGHILDPRTGRPAAGLIAVTVLAPTAIAADGWGTALFVLGLEAAKRKARERDDLDAVLVSPGDGIDTVWVERPLEGVFRLEPAASRLFHVVIF